MSRRHCADVESSMLASGAEPVTLQVLYLQAILVPDCAAICCRRGLSPVYELYGVVVHCASNGKTLESGHYVNFIRCALYAP